MGKITSNISAEGKRFEVRRTLIFKITISIDGHCIIDLRPRDGAVERFLRQWRGMSGGIN